jgi:TatD DNase family protein
MIDTHAHLNFPDLATDLDGVIDRAREAGIEGFVIPGTSLETSQQGIALAKTHNNMWAGVGVHPVDTEEIAEREVLTALLSEEKVVAIGEIGLDNYHLPGEPGERKRLQSVQEERFRFFAGLGLQHNLPLIIHSRDCFAEMYALLKELSIHHFVIHCFTGTWEEASAWLDLGGHLSFTGIITYPKNDELREVVKKVPANRFMLETDAPFLPPEGHRGEVGEPRFVHEVAECVAAARWLSLSEVDTRTTKTAEEFFGITLLHG